MTSVSVLYPLETLEDFRCPVFPGGIDRNIGLKWVIQDLNKVIGIIKLFL